MVYCHLTMCALFQGLVNHDDINYGLRITDYELQIFTKHKISKLKNSLSLQNNLFN